MTRSLRCDIAVLGGGPAGSAAAIALARQGFDVLLVEAGDYAAPRIGETFPPGLDDLLAELGVLAEIAPLRLPSPMLRSAWGDPEPQDHSHIVHPRGLGWHVDRARFDQALAQCAVRAGARLITRARLTGAQPGWALSLDWGGQPLCIAARLVIDATGRRASFARRQGAARVARDGLVATAYRLDAPLGSYGPYALIETVPDGWWYSAPTPGDRAIAVRFGLAGQAAAPPPLTLDRHRGLDLGLPERHAAGAARLSQAEGSGWLAVGDAAMAFDPMSGDGVCRAIRSGIDGAQRLLAGGHGWTAEIAARFTDYARQRAEFYRAEQRWSDRPFWRWAHALSPEALAA